MKDIEMFEAFCDANLRIPFGRHAGTLISETPMDYLHWMLNTCVLDQDIKIAIQSHVGDFKPCLKRQARRLFRNQAMLDSILDAVAEKHHPYIGDLHEHEQEYYEY